VKFYYANNEDNSYSAVIAGTSEEQMREVLNDQLGLEEDWEFTPLDELDVDIDNPIILTDGW
jgi:hypothetical protein